MSFYQYFLPRIYPCYQSIMHIFHSISDASKWYDIDYHNYVGIYVMVALPNTPFGDDAYLKKYGVKIRQTPPAFYHHEHPPDQLLEDLEVFIGHV